MASSLRGDSDLLADDLRPITRVMYSSALIPGGEYFFLNEFHFTATLVLSDGSFSNWVLWTGAEDNSMS